MKFFKLLVLVSVILCSCENEESTKKESVSRKTEKNQRIQEDNKLSQNIIHEDVIIDTIYPIPEWKPEQIQDKFKNGKNLINKYSKYIIDSLKDTVHITMVDHSKSEIRYLGEIMLLESNKVYHVFTDFTINGIGVMLSPRGHSKIIFMSTDLKGSMYQTLDLPEELPYKIVNNQLLFRQDSTEIRLSIAEKLPLLFCIPKIGCN
jgi:hypothetical protein